MKANTLKITGPAIALAAFDRKVRAIMRWTVTPTVALIASIVTCISCVWIFIVLFAGWPRSWVGVLVVSGLPFISLALAFVSARELWRSGWDLGRTRPRRCSRWQTRSTAVRCLRHKPETRQNACHPVRRPLAYAHLKTPRRLSPAASVGRRQCSGDTRGRPLAASSLSAVV
jgi:hypothetical protein